MGTAKNQRRNPTRGLDSERLLDEYYGKLQKWGVVLTRGDWMMAQEIVQDLCLHFVVANPDLSQIENLDVQVEESSSIPTTVRRRVHSVRWDSRRP